MRKILFAVLMVCVGVLAFSPVRAQGANDAQGQPEVSANYQHDQSIPLRSMPHAARAEHPRELPLRLPPETGNGGPGGTDRLIQPAPGPLVGTTNGLNFAGVGNGDYGFSPNAAPPDTNLAVGATQVVQWVNESFAVFNKSNGALVYGPVAGNTLWSGFGGGCEANNDGDPVVQYDQIANRWVFTQFSVSTQPYLQCVAVSQTSDATGSYNRYSFSYGNTQFPDYPKLGVWPDGYYLTYNIFNNGSTFAGPKVCAFDRASMLNGAAATQQCFQLSTSQNSLLPADLDGTALPPTGAPNYLVSRGGTSALYFWKFHVDWTTPANTTLSARVSIPVASFYLPCGGSGGTCVAQPGTAQKLDTLGDRLMYRLSYRNFGTYESLLVNQSVGQSSSRKAATGVRWYEIRSPAGTPTVYQQSTFAPDSNYRWMGSIAQDKQGNIALGYSVSSSTIYPSIRYTGRLVTDPLNTLQAENSIISGGGSQLQNLSRWGDYSAMDVDPVDGCTFFYTNEYLKSSGTFNWSTQIASFKFPGCN